MKELEYTHEAFTDMGMRLDAAIDYVELLTLGDGKKENMPSPFSIALTLKMLIEPVADFLGWADTFASILGNEEPGADA